MAVTYPTLDAATLTLLQAAKSKIDAPSLVEEVRQTWFSVQAGLLRASAAARAIVATGKPTAVAADLLRSNGVVLKDQVERYTQSANKAAIDAALAAIVGLTADELAASVAHLLHGCNQMAMTPTDGSDVVELCDMIDASYTTPKTL